MNRCVHCGKFRPWGSLVFKWALEHSDIYGGIDEREWFECAPGGGCAD